jgi:alpha-mannosidase
LLNETKYGHRCTGDEVEMTLLRSGYDPDPYPDQGPHMIRYSLLPHGGDWQAGGVAQAAREYNLPALAIETPPNEAPGTRQQALGTEKSDLPSASQLPDASLSLSPDNFILSALKKAEDGDAFIVRFYEAYGLASRAVLTLPQAVKSAVRVDLLEMDLLGAAAPTIQGNSVTLDVKPREVVTLKLAF